MLARYFLFMIMPLYGAAFLYQVYIGEYNFGDYRVAEHWTAYLRFAMGLAIGTFLIEVVTRSFGYNRYATKHSQQVRIPENVIQTIRTPISVLGLLAAAMAAWYVVDGGYEKILLLGSNINSLDYRFIGVESQEGLLPVVLELSRRIVLPFTILALLSLNLYSKDSKWAVLLIITTVQLIASVINLDRGPILMFIVLFAYYFIFRTKNLVAKLITGMVTIVLIGLIGAVFTFLQYNNLDFSWQDIKDTLYGILINRVILSPIKMSQTWVFDILQSPLYLEFARISVLWGGAYLGSRDAFSQYVAPVGIIGDVYRNFGMAWMMTIGLLTGGLFKIIEARIANVAQNFHLPLNFVCIILSMYLFYGNIFSLGPFAIIVFLLSAPTVATMVSASNSQSESAMMNSHGGTLQTDF